MQAMMVHAANRGEWLAARRSGIGASEAAAVLGLSPYETALDLYFRKTGQLPDDDAPTEVMEIGTLMEGPIAELYQRRTGRMIERTQVFMRDIERHHLFATLDAIDDHGIAVEFKTIGGPRAADLGDEDTDQIPVEWIVQAHQQMYVSERDSVIFAVLVNGRSFRLYRVDCEYAFFDAMLPRLDVFWECVRKREPPAYEPLKAGHLSHLLYPRAEGEIGLVGAAVDIAEEYIGTGVLVRQLETRRSQLRALLLAEMGEAASAVLPDGRVITRKIVTVPEGPPVARKGYTKVDLRVKEPKGETL